MNQIQETFYDYAPMTPDQRPKMIGCYLLLPIVAMFAIAVVIIQANVIYKMFRYDKNTSTEVAHVTTETAATANELLLQLNEKLQDFDQQSRDIFGKRHTWIEGGKRAKTPDEIFRFVQDYQDLHFLEEYFKIGQSRVQHKVTLEELERTVDQTVVFLPEDASAESIFKAERIVRKQIYNELKKLELNQELLLDLGKRYSGAKQ